jgi:hypothetical protein
LSFLVSCNKSRGKIILKSNSNIGNQCLPHFSDDLNLEKQRIIIFGEKDNYYRDFSKNELNKIEMLFPVFKEKYPSSPFAAYNANRLPKKFINQNGVEEVLDFGDPLGGDDFYLLYSYYLKQKNGDIKYKDERAKLIQLYETINNIYLSWSPSLMYYGHQAIRLNACAEYSIYLLDSDEDYYNYKFDFEKQKELYLRSLSQFVADEFNRKSGIPYNNEKEVRKTKEIVLLEKLITNYYYLEQVRTFEMEYYRIKTINL